MSKNRHNNGKGFTIAELLVALMVTSIILAAVATLAFAMSSVKESTDDTSTKEAQLRYATLRLTDLLRNSKLVCAVVGNDVAVWRSDDNDNGNIDTAELVYIEAGSDQKLKLLEPDSVTNSIVLLSNIQNGSDLAGGKYKATTLASNCSDVQFLLDVSPPMSRFMSISFNVTENRVVRQYQISVSLRGWAGNLLDKTASSIVSDDD